MTPQRENRDLKKAPPQPPPLAFRVPSRLKTLDGKLKKKLCHFASVLNCLFDLGFGSMNLGQKARLLCDSPKRKP